MMAKDDYNLPSLEEVRTVVALSSPVKLVTTLPVVPDPALEILKEIRDEVLTLRKTYAGPLLVCSNCGMIYRVHCSNCVIGNGSNHGKTNHT